MDEFASSAAEQVGPATAFGAAAVVAGADGTVVAPAAAALIDPSSVGLWKEAPKALLEGVMWALLRRE